ncbi:glycosyltransferase family 4 protein, partial [bacterium]|nr:glycosyltransferase family 4 protein [bacterium]
EVVLFIVGGTKKEIEKYKRKSKENIYFIEFQKQEKVPIYLKAADILVLPNSATEEISKSYTSPLKLFEYMASKRPIVASNLSSIREIVNENDVLFFRPNDEKDLALKIEKLIYDKALQNRLIKNAYRKVKNYTWEKRAKKIVDIFKYR